MNYSGIMIFILLFDSEITQNFTYFEKMGNGYRGLDSEIAQNFAIFEKMAQKKL